MRRRRGFLKQLIRVLTRPFRRPQSRRPPSWYGEENGNLHAFPSKATRDAWHALLPEVRIICTANSPTVRRNLRKEIRHA